MLDPTSPIISFYPEEFEVDMEGVPPAMPWLGVALLPFVDADQLKQVLAEHGDFTEEEERRNMPSEALLFIHKDSLFEDIMENVGENWTECNSDAIGFCGEMRISQRTPILSETIRPNIPQWRPFKNSQVYCFEWKRGDIKALFGILKHAVQPKNVLSQSDQNQNSKYGNRNQNRGGYQNHNNNNYNRNQNRFSQNNNSNFENNNNRNQAKFSQNNASNANNDNTKVEKHQKESISVPKDTNKNNSNTISSNSSSDFKITTNNRFNINLNNVDNNKQNLGSKRPPENSNSTEKSPNKKQKVELISISTSTNKSNQAQEASKKPKKNTNKIPL